MERTRTHARDIGLALCTLILVAAALALPQAALAEEEIGGTPQVTTLQTQASDNVPTPTLLTQASVNNSIRTAAKIPVNYSRTSPITKSCDVRFYKFTVQWSGKWRINLTSWLKNRTNIALYDRTGSRIDSWNIYRDNTAGHATFSKTFDLTRGDYYFSVQGDDYGNFSFKTSFTSAQETFAEFAGRKNNDTISAIQDTQGISFNKTYRGQIALNDPKDFYKFKVNYSGTVTLKASSWINGSTCYAIYDANGNEVCSDSINIDSVKGMSTYSSSYSLHKGGSAKLRPGVYYLCVSRRYSNDSYTSGDSGNYQFRLGYTSAKEAFPDWLAGSDDAFDKANSIQTNRTYRGQIAINQDQDWFKFTANSYETTVKLTSWVDWYGNNDSWASTHLDIYDSNGNRINNGYWYRNTVSGKATGEITFSTDYYATYRICVRTGSDNYFGNYQLRVE